ncbi:MAG TPA: ABC transporter permease, partial [Cyanothece sp. UBA12306]|nr:ABC transporter permease [Cyanothece sp. UBA12306]
GVMVGNASFITLVGVGQGVQQLATEQFKSLGTDVLFIVPEISDPWGTTYQKPKTLVFEDAKAIATQVPAVKAVAPETQSMEIVTYGNKVIETRVIGTTQQYLYVRSFDVKIGRFFEELELNKSDQVVVLGSDVAKKIFKNQSPINKYIRIKNQDFLVIGVLQPKGTVMGTNLDDSVIIPITTMANRIGGKTSLYGIELSFMSVSAKDEKKVNAAQFQIQNLLRQRHQAYDFSIQTQQDLLKTANQITNALTLLLGAIAGISLLVGGIGIMNIMLVSVNERISEIGLRKALGATSKDILIQFLIEAIILSFIGGIIGLFSGIGGSFLIAWFTPLKASISPIAIILSLGISGSIGLFFGVTPARQAAQLDPIIALRTV